MFSLAAISEKIDVSSVRGIRVVILFQSEIIFHLSWTGCYLL